MFGRENGGFDAIVGNPPFCWEEHAIDSHRDGYLDWLKIVHDESHGNADLVAHFFRRAFNLLRQDGCFGLIATNTIGQGDTRSTGLRWICTHGGTIYRCHDGGIDGLAGGGGRQRGPRVSTARSRGPFTPGRPNVSQITAYLFHAGGHDDPARLRANAGKSFQGSFVLGMGFTFDDTDTKGVASPLAEMRELIAKDPRNAERIFPYIGGEEVNNSPTHAHHRYVINFGEMTEEEARQWPDLMRIVEEKVKPTAEQGQTRYADRKYWWRFGRNYVLRYSVPFEAWSGCSCCPIICAITLSFAFLRTNQCSRTNSRSFPSISYAGFAVLNRGVHEVWARFFCSSMKDDLRYTPPTASRPFPFPENFETERAPRSHRQGILRVPRRAHGPQQRGPDQDLQPLPRPGRALARHPEAPRAARRHGPRRARRLRLDRPRSRRASSCSTTRRTRTTRTARRAARSPGATAGPTTSATKCWPACWNSTNSAPNRNAWPV